MLSRIKASQVVAAKLIFAAVFVSTISSHAEPASSSTSFSGVSAEASAGAVESSTAKAPTTASSVATPTRSYKGELGFTLFGRKLQDEVVNSRFARMVVAASLTANYQDWLTAKLGVLQFLTSGQSSNLYAVTEGAASNVTLIDEGYIKAALSSTNWTVSAAAGIISANLSPIYSNMMSQSNAGVSLLGGYQNDANGEVLIFAEQSAPTSKSTSNRIIDDDTLPLMTVGGLRGVLPVAKTGTKIKAAVARFVFTDLSSQSANDSSTIGNTTTGNGKGGYSFAYDFRGIESSLVVEQDLFLADRVTLKGAAVKNELAPAGANSGWTGKIEYKKAFNKFELIPSLVRFRIESDSIPASYGQTGIFTNRVGTGYGLRLDFPAEKFSAYAGFTEADVINNNTTSSIYQSDRQTYTLGAEAKYDIF